jgi:hypothetical protein
MAQMGTEKKKCVRKNSEGICRGQLEENILHSLAKIEENLGLRQ